MEEIDVFSFHFPSKRSNNKSNYVIRLVNKYDGL